MNHIIKKLSRLMLDARSEEGMIAGMPKITVGCLDLDVLLTRLNAQSERIAELESLLKKFKPMDEDGHGGDFVYNEDSTHLGESVMKALKEQGK